MVFCGRPSKACQRCRDRRLRCDLRSGSCGQCGRANIACRGYRNTQQLRIRNESHAVQRKALSRKNSRFWGPRPLVVSLDSQARDAFFAHYVTGTSKAWDFLTPFFDSAHSPAHLTLSIDAVSLAYLSHQVHSDTALATAREKYVSALHMLNKALESPGVAAEDTTILAPLLLDLFEKITNTEPQHGRSWTSHVNGALALVGLRGLEQFRGPSALRVLVRLSTNILISCVASESPVPIELNALRAHAETYLNVGDPKWRLSGLIAHYADLRGDIRRGRLSIDSFVSISMELDAKFQTFTLDMPPAWHYKTTMVDRKSERIYYGHFDSYPDRHTAQTWNVLRLVRILLNECILEQCLASAGNLEAGLCSLLVRMANEKIEVLAQEICASVPQYVDCLGAARGRLSTSGEADIACAEAHHLHSPSQILDCYTLIFPLFVCGRSKSSPDTLKPWVIRQLQYMSSHFGIRNAKLVGGLLEQGTDVGPWAVYAKLGSYAFAA